MSCWTVLFSSAILASGTIDKALIKGFLTIQDQELFTMKVTMNANFVKNTLKSRFSGAKTAPLAVRVFTRGGGGGHHTWANLSLRTADAFPVVASLPPI